jgi:hypothetical protein
MRVTLVLNHPAIAARPAKDAIAELNRKLREGTLQFEGGTGYLRPVLEALGVPVER